MKQFFAFLIAVTPCSAVASDWQMFITPTGDAPNRHAWFLDQSSVEASGGGKQAWVEMINEKTDAQPLVMKTLIEFDCVGHRSRFIAIQMFDANGSISDNEKPDDWMYIAPDSSVEMISIAVCKDDFDNTVSTHGYSLKIMAEALFDVVR